MLQINSGLKQQLNIPDDLVVHHWQTDAAECSTQQLINRCVSACDRIKYVHIKISLLHFMLWFAVFMSIAALLLRNQLCVAPLCLVLCRMVSELSEGHATDWDVYLPAKVFALCFQERPGGGGSGGRPFSLLCCSGLQPVRQPRGLQVSPAHNVLCQVGWSPRLTCSLPTVNGLRNPGEPPGGQSQSPQLTK